MAVSAQAISFPSFARGQASRDDPIGDFCRDFLACPSCRDLSARDDILGALRNGHQLHPGESPEYAVDAFDRAWTEYAGW